jgi:hypothetical protein
MKLFKKKDKNIEAEETLAKNAESAKTAADGKNAGAAQEIKEDVPETIVCPRGILFCFLCYTGIFAICGCFFALSVLG